jgi:glyoxylase-like metal-dependent hydrolase (beta-lactamase superfamily II)
VNLYAANAHPYAPVGGDGQIHPWPLQGGLWLLAGETDNSNVVVQLGGDGALVVDTGTRAMAPELLAQIRHLVQEHGGDQKAIRLIIDTNGLADHIGGNDLIREAGSTIVGSAGGAGRLTPGSETRGLAGVIPGALVLASQNVLTRLAGESSASGAAAAQVLWPTDTEDFDLYNTWFNGEAVRLFHPHSASTDGQLMVQFRRSDVIAAGDVVNTDSYPLIDTTRGGSIDGELVALNQLIDLAVPAERQEGGTVVVPGHGPLGDQSDVVHYRNMLTIIRNRVQFYKNQGKSLQQVLAFGVTADYDRRWGASPGAVREFISAVYQTLPRKGPMFSMHTVTLVPSTDTISGFRMY